MPDVVPRVQGQDLFVPRRGHGTARIRAAGIGLPVYRGLMSGWDNTARRGCNSHIFHGGDARELRGLVDGASSTTRAGTTRATTGWCSSTPGTSGAKAPTSSRTSNSATAFSRRRRAPSSACPTPAALISTLRQITAGNEEAQGVLDELEHAIRINEEHRQPDRREETSQGRCDTDRLLRPVPSGRASRRHASGEE